MRFTLGKRDYMYFVLGQNNTAINRAYEKMNARLKLLKLYLLSYAEGGATA